jgi:DNA-binding SARP family transcriptional activator
MHQEPILEFSLMGRPALHVVQRDGSRLEVVLPTKKALALLAFLALNTSAARAEMAGLLWGDSTDAEARKNLRQDVYRLQCTPVGAWLEAGRQHLALRGTVRVDVLELREAASLGDVESVLRLARGVFLEGLNVPSASEFETWLDAEREACGRMHRAALNAKAVHLEQSGDLRGAMATLEQLVRLDALQEAPQRELMRLHWVLGERAEALSRFSRLSALLQDELGMDPSAETLALEAQIRASVNPESPSSGPMGVSKDHVGAQRRALLHLRIAQALFETNANAEQITFHLERAAQPLEALLNSIRMVHLGAFWLERDFSAVRLTLRLVEARIAFSNTTVTLTPS